MSGAANAIDEEWVEKKLKSANSSQDSVQSLSLWALNHKTQHEKIVGIWFKVLKTAKLDLRLTLFYLCNEVVQTCKRKHAIVFKDAFKEVLKDAALLVRDNSIRPNIERIFKIWEERRVYNKEFVDELMAILNNTKFKSTLSTRLLAEFKPDELMLKVKRMAEIEEEVETKRLQLSEQEWHSVDVESFKQQLKDRHECGQYVDQANDCRMQLESYVTDLLQENRHRSVLIELLEQSELFYDAQNSEAAIVATAYKNFGSRVNTLHKKLTESRKPQKNSSGIISSESERGSRLKKNQDPLATPTEDEFDDDSCDELMNSSVQNCDSRDDSSERSIMGLESVEDAQVSQRKSNDGSRSPIVSNDFSVTTDAINNFGSLLPNLGSSTHPCFLPLVASHSSHSLELSNNARGFGLNAFSDAIVPVDDEDAGGATPVQDEEPNDEISLTPMEFLKQMIQDSTKPTTRRISASSDHSLAYPGHPLELTSANMPQSTTTSWSAVLDSTFSEAEGHHTGTVVYEGYEDSYDVVYHNTGVGQEIPATAVYGPETVQTYKVYAPTYTDHSDSSQTYVVETGSVDGYPCSADGYEAVLETYPPPPDAEYQAVYQEHLMSAVVEDGYSEVGDVYSLVQGDNYQPQTVSAGSYYGLVEHVQDISPQPSVVYHPVQSYTQPPPTFPHPTLSLAPNQSFSHPPPSASQPAALAFIQPTSFTTPPPLNQPPPPLFALPQNSSVPPPVPQSFVEPLPPHRLISPTSLKTAIGFPSPPVLVSPSSSPALEMGSSNCLSSPPFRMQSGVKHWNKRPYNQFRLDHDRSSAVLRDPGRFENIAGHSDVYRMGRNPQNTRRTNLTYLTTDEDKNGIDRTDLATAEAKPRYPSTALRSMSLPCDASSIDQANGLRSVSPRSSSRVGAFTRSPSSLSVLDSLPAQTDQKLDMNDVGIERDGGSMLSNTGEGCDGFEKSSSNEDSIQLNQNTGDDSLPTQLTVRSIPSLGISSSQRTLLPRNWTPRLRHCRPELGSVRPLGSFRFRADNARRFPRKPHFVAQQMPFQRNF